MKDANRFESGIRWKDGNLEEWSVTAYLAQQDANEYLIDGILPKRSHMLMYAPTGPMKSFVAIHLGCCIATGTPFNKQAVEQGDVIYIAAEAPREIAKRIKAWQDYYGFDEDVVRFFPTTVRFKDEDSVQRLERFIDHLDGSVKLVIFDTAARCASGIDEDNNSEVQQFVNDPLTRLITTYELSVLIVHHTGKGSASPRGAAAWSDACDTVARVETTFTNKELRKDPLYTVLQVEKLRGDEPMGVAFRPVKASGTLVLERATLDEAKASKPKQGRPRKETSLRKDGTERVRGRAERRNTPSLLIQCIEQGIRTPSEMSEKASVPLKTVRNTLTTLKQRGIVWNQDGHWFKNAA